MEGWRTDHHAEETAGVHEGWRRLRDQHSQDALPLPAGTVRARLPGSVLPEEQQTQSKVLILDANPDIVSKKGLFTAAWKDLYPGMVEYRANAMVTQVNPDGKIAKPNSRMSKPTC